MGANISNWVRARACGCMDVCARGHAFAAECKAREVKGGRGDLGVGGGSSANEARLFSS